MACGPLLRLSSSKRCPNLSGYSYNSPEVIYRHYAGKKRDLQVPEL